MIVRDAQEWNANPILNRKDWASDDRLWRGPFEGIDPGLPICRASERDDPPLQRDLQGSEGPNRPLGRGRTAFRRSRSAFGQLSA